MEAHVDAIPQFIQSFADRFGTVFTREIQRERFCQYLASLYLQTERKNTQGISRAMVGVDDQAVHHFLLESPWDHDEMNRLRVALLDSLPQTQSRRDGIAVLDDSGSPRRGTKIANTKRQYIGQVGKVTNGYVQVTTHYADPDKHWPVDLSPYRPKEWTSEQKPFKTKYEIGLKLLKAARETHHLRFRVAVMDPWYGRSAEFLQRLCDEEIPFVAALEAGTKVTTKLPTDPFRDTPHKVKDALGAFRPEDYRKVILSSSKGPMARWVVEFRGHRSRMKGKQRFFVVVEDPNKPEEGEVWFLVTNCPREYLSAEQAVEAYHLRNWVEVGYREAKQELGANQCVCVGEKAQVRHWLLVQAAHSLVTFLKRTGAFHGFCRRTLGSWLDHLRAVRDWLSVLFQRWQQAHPEHAQALTLARTGFAV